MQNNNREAPQHTATSTTVDTTALSDQRRAGVCLHLTSLPGPHGIGEIGRDAHTFIDQMRSAGLSVWQFLPNGPTAYGDSPYQPLSAYAGNPMLIELRELVELGLLKNEELSVLTELPADAVDYGVLIPLKSRLLKTAAARFFALPHSALHQSFDAFCNAEHAHWLADYALFAALKNHHDGWPWPQWPSVFRHRDHAALSAFAAAHTETIRAIKFAQFLFHRQWQALRDYAHMRGVMLFGDMPIYIALDCADAWAQRELLRIDEDGTAHAVAGVPPDYFSSDGQLWGNPLYDWSFHERTGFAWWIERLRHAMQQADLVRIDHFRGFEAYWSVPGGDKTARNGHWESGPNDAVFNAMRNVLGDIPIVAEDLGDISQAVHDLRHRLGVPGMSVLQFMIGDDDFDAAQIAADQVCYTGTHDNDTTLGWFHGNPDSDVRSDDEIQRTQYNTRRHAGGSIEDVNWSLIRVAYDSRACIAVAPMQDYLGLGSEARLNTPGKPGGNWRWRLLSGAFDEALRSRLLGLASASRRLA